MYCLNNYIFKYFLLAEEHDSLQRHLVQNIFSRLVNLNLDGIPLMIYISEKLVAHNSIVQGC